MYMYTCTYRLIHKAIQDNTTQLTQDTQLAFRQMLYQLTYKGSSAGWAKSHIYTYVQTNTTQGQMSPPEDQVNSNMYAEADQSN